MASASAAIVLRHIRQWACGPNAAQLADQQLLQRFVTQREEAAFSALVERHGPMVLRVCQRVLHDRHAAEDAFQATFLVLVRKAGAIRKRQLLANWLYCVAYRIAMRAKVDAAKRRNREERGEPKSPTDPVAEVTGRELCAVLDEELNRLPERYRAPFHLCYLEGLTRDQVAQRLGWSLRTLQRRLEQGRRLLQRRLTRRSVTLSAALLAAGLSKQAASAAVPPLLVISTVKAATVFAASDGVAAAGISAPAAALAEEILRGLAVAKMKVVIMLVLAVGLASASAGLIAYQALGSKQGQAAQEQKPPVAAKSGERLQPEQTRQARVDRYGDPLPEEALARLGTVRFRDSNHITSLAFAGDGKTLVSHGWGGIIRVWETATGKELYRFPRQAGQTLGACALAPDAKLAAAVNYDGTDAIGLWELARERQVRAFGKTRFRSLCFSPDGKVLAAYGDNIIVELWEVATGKQLHSWKAHDESVTDAAFTRDGRTLVTCGFDKAIRFWDVATGKRTRDFAGSPNGVAKLALSPNGKLVASIGVTLEPIGAVASSWHTDHFARIWDVAAGKEMRQITVPDSATWPGFRGKFEALAFTPDSRELVTGGPDDILRVWDPLTGRELRQLARDCPSAWALAFSPDGNTLAAAAGGKAIRLFDLQTGKDLFPPPGHQNMVKATVLSLDGQALATVSYEQTIRVWNPATSRERYRLEGHGAMVTSMQPGGDGRTLWSAGADKTLRAWDLATGKELRRLPVDRTGGFPQLLAVAPDGRAAALAAADKSVVLLDLATSKELQRFKGHPTRVSGASFGPDRHTLVVWTGDNTVHVWDTTTGREVRQFPFFQESDTRRLALPPGGYVTYTAEVSPDGKVIAYGNHDHVLMLLEVGTGKEIRRLTNLPDGIRALTFSPDGKTLAWGGWRDPTVHLVEVATGRQRHQLVGEQGQGGVSSLTFSADGKTLVSGNDDTTVLIWDLTGRLRAKEPWAKPLAPAELNACWADLAGEDAARAYQAIRKLAAAVAQAVPYLGKRLQPVPAVDEKRLAQLITDLDSSRFALRENAGQELAKLEELALPAYQKALAAQPSLEVRRRLERLLEKQTQVWRNPSPERLRGLRALEVLELAGIPEAGQVLEALSKGAPEARLTQDAKAALERLAKRRGNQR